MKVYRRQRGGKGKEKVTYRTNLQSSFPRCDECLRRGNVREWSEELPAGCQAMLVQSNFWPPSAKTNTNAKFLGRMNSRAARENVSVNSCRLRRLCECLSMAQRHTERRRPGSQWVPRPVVVRTNLAPRKQLKAAREDLTCGRTSLQLNKHPGITG